MWFSWWKREQSRRKRKAEDDLYTAEKSLKHYRDSGPATKDVGTYIPARMDGLNKTLETINQDQANPMKNWACDRDTDFKSRTHGDIEAFNIIKYRDVAHWGGNTVRSSTERVPSPKGDIFDGIHRGCVTGFFTITEKAGEVGHCKLIPGNGWTRQDLTEIDDVEADHKAILLASGEPLPDGCSPGINVLRFHGLRTPWNTATEAKWTVLDLPKITTFRHDHPIDLVSGTMQPESRAYLNEQIKYYAGQLETQNDAKIRARDPQMQAPEPIVHSSRVMSTLCITAAAPPGTKIEFQQTPDIPALDAQDSVWTGYEDSVLRIIENKEKADAAGPVARKKSASHTKTERSNNAQPTAVPAQPGANANAKQSSGLQVDTRGPVTQAASALGKVQVNMSSKQATGGASPDHGEGLGASREKAGAIARFGAFDDDF